jgi:hypothetical protein
VDQPRKDQDRERRRDLDTDERARPKAPPAEFPRDAFDEAPPSRTFRIPRI